jgi:hypoxanthine phosphoribosyltransferase
VDQREEKESCDRLAKLSVRVVPYKLSGVADVAALPGARYTACSGREPEPETTMPAPQPYAPDPSKGVMIVDWPLFGELARALAVRVAREWTPELVVGIATAGVVPGAAVAAMLDLPFHSILITRRHHAEHVRETPAVFGGVPGDVRGRRVLVVDQTCDSGATMRLAVNAVGNGGASDIRTAVSFKTGPFVPDYFALATESMIVLPWDREVMIDGDLRPNPKYVGLLPQP